MNQRHFVFYKPDGVLSQFVSAQTKRKNKQMLGDFFDFPEGTMAIGRLDEPSEGLLFLTTDGKTSERVRSKSVEKEYWVQVDGDLTEEAINQLQNGVEISIEGKPYKTLPCSAFRFGTKPQLPVRRKKIRDERHGPTSWLSVTLTEGKYRQVRKMTAAVGFPTLRLIRVRIGNHKLGNLKPGEVVEVRQFDL